MTYKVVHMKGMDVGFRFLEKKFQNSNGFVTDVQFKMKRLFLIGSIQSDWRLRNRYIFEYFFRGNKSLDPYLQFKPLGTFVR